MVKSAYPGFSCMKQLKVFLLPPPLPWMRCYFIAGLPFPQAISSPVPFIHLGGERQRESKVSCPTQEHNTMTPDRSRVERPNHEANAPPLMILP